MGKVIVLLFNFLTLFLIKCSPAYDTKDFKCETNKAQLCGGLYNQTRFPNYFHQRVQDDAVVELNNYKDLVFTGCAEHLRLFLCSLFVPMCTMLDENLLPCRSLCDDVKLGCEKVLLQYVGLSWPERLDCKQFPVSGNGKICIEDKRHKSKPVKPRKKVWVPVNEKVEIKENETAILVCQGKKKIHFRKIVHVHHSNCKRHVSQENIRKRCNGEHLCEIQLTDLTKLKGQSKDCVPGKVGPAILKFHCTEDKPAKQMKLKYGEDANLYCKSSIRHIKIIKVQFRDESENNMCITPNAFCRVTQSCTGKQNCVLWANRQYIPSPCKGQKPTLIVDYECEKTVGEEKVLIDYWENIVLHCPSGGVMNIVRAEYIGRSCSSKNIHCAVNLFCKKKSRCVLKKSDYTAVKCDLERSKIRVRYTCS